MQHHSPPDGWGAEVVLFANYVPFLPWTKILNKTRNYKWHGLLVSWVTIQIAKKIFLKTNCPLMIRNIISVISEKRQSDPLASKAVLDIFQMYLHQRCCLMLLVNNMVLDMISELLYIYLGSIVTKNMYWEKRVVWVMWIIQKGSFQHFCIIWEVDRNLGSFSIFLHWSENIKYV